MDTSRTILNILYSFEFLYFNIYIVILFIKDYSNGPKTLLTAFNLLKSRKENISNLEADYEDALAQIRA